MKTPADAAERDRIRTSLHETLVVEAAAGTGKTTVLIERLINVLAEGQGKVDTVAAVTFTRKAAGELKLRLRAGLETARRDAAPGSRRQHLTDAIARLEEARINTIDGFCAELLRERPVEARVDPAFQVLTDNAEALFDQAFTSWIQMSLADPPEGLRRALRRRPSHRNSLDEDGNPMVRLERAARALATWRYLRAPWRRPAFDRGARIETLANQLHNLANRVGTCTNRSDALFVDTEAARHLSADIVASERLQPRDMDGLESALIELAYDRRFRRPRRGSPRAYPTVQRDDIVREHGHLLAALYEFERDADADLAALLQQELFAVVDRYEVLKTRQGGLDFTDLLVRTRDLLRDNAQVRRFIQERLTHIFVDEFQDTDPLQAEILLLLSADDPAVTDWRRIVPIPGKLFLVGDPKQSIYRFRGADVGTYQEVKTVLGTGGATVLHLTTSFRAVPSIQQLVNRTFAPAMHEDPRTAQAGYVALTPYREERTQTAIIALPVPSPYSDQGNVTKTAIRKSVPNVAAALIRWLLDAEGWTVIDPETKEPVRIAPRHICVLLKQLSAWQADITQSYLEALEAREIPHLLVGGKSFYGREEVNTLRTALAAIEWPDDELSLYASLKGPFFAIGDAELFEYRHRFGRLHPYRVVAPGTLPDHLAPIAQALTMFHDLHARRNVRPVEETIHQLLAATRAHAAFVLRPRGEQVLANVMRIADLARAYEASGGLSFRGFIDRLHRDSNTEAPEAPILEESSEGVRIMTVHKAKGLEFPIVILGDPVAPLSHQRADRHTDINAGLCALRLGGPTGWSPWDLLDHEADELDRDRAEGLRVAYVAATRARDLLVIPVLGDDPFDGAWPAADEGWTSTVQRAAYPKAAARQTPAVAADCPPFGADGTVDRSPGDSAGPRTVRPGRHTVGDINPERYDVVWWDPHTLALQVPPTLGVRREDLISATADPATVADGLHTYETWRGDGEAVRQRAEQPSVVFQTVHERARHSDAAADEAGAAVTIVDAAVGLPRPGGPRFGSLVHATMAIVPLDATSEQIGGVTRIQAKILGATPQELEAAQRIVAATLAHPLLRSAEAASRYGRCRREVPIAWVEPSGLLMEGVLDLAFEENGRWTVLDFKTDRELGTAENNYRRQVGLYTRALAQATRKASRGILIRV